MTWLPEVTLTGSQKKERRPKLSTALLRANIAFGGVFLVLGLTIVVRALLWGGFSPTAGLLFGLLLVGVGALRLWAGLRKGRA